MGKDGAARVSGCVSSCLLFPDWLSREHAGTGGSHGSPAQTGITSLSFLNVFEHFSWIPRSGCSLELHDSVRLLVCMCVCGVGGGGWGWLPLLSIQYTFTSLLSFTMPPTFKVLTTEKGIMWFSDLWKGSQGAFLVNLRNQVVENSACRTTSSNDISERRNLFVVGLQVINQCMGNPAFPSFFLSRKQPPGMSCGSGKTGYL